MNRQPRRRNLLKHVNILCAGGCQHLGSLHRDVLGHCMLIGAPGAIDLERGNAPGVQLVLLNFYVIVVVWQALTESTDTHAPLSRLLQRVLEVRAEARHSYATAPSFAASPTLITVTAQEFFLLRLHVPETRDIDAVRAIAEGHFVFVPGHRSAGSG